MKSAVESQRNEEWKSFQGSEGRCDRRQTRAPPGSIQESLQGKMTSEQSRQMYFKHKLAGLDGSSAEEFKRMA